MAGCFAHIERVAAVDREAEIGLLATVGELLHAIDVKADVNVAQVTPITVVKYLLWGAVLHLHQLQFGLTQEPAESTHPVLIRAKDHSPEFVLTSGHTFKIFKFLLTVIKHLGVAKNVAIKL